MLEEEDVIVEEEANKGKSLNILFLTMGDLPNYGPDSVFIGLKKLGYSVEDYPVKRTFHTNDVGRYRIWPQVIQNFPATRLIYYDLVIADTRTSIKPPPSLPLVILDGEDHPEMSRVDLYQNCLFYFKREYTKDFEKYSKCLPLPFGLVRNYEMGKRPIVERKIDVSFLMSTTSHVRKAYHEAIERLRQNSKYNIASNLGNIPYEKYISLLKDSKIAISLRGAGWDTYRYWEIPYCGAVLFSEFLEIKIPDNFEKGVEAEFFSSPEMLYELLDSYLSQPELLQQMQEKAMKKLLEKHTAEARAKYVLNKYFARMRMLPETVRVDLGCGVDKSLGYVGINKIKTEGVDIVADVAREGIPLDDCSIDEVRAHRFLEYITDKIFIMNEIYRVLKPEGRADIVVFSMDSQGVSPDPSHVSFWNEDTLKLFCQGPTDDLVDYPIRCRFEKEELYTTSAGPAGDRYVVAKLIALK